MNYDEDLNGCNTQAICVERCLITNYYEEFEKIPFDITFVPDDPFWLRALNRTLDQLYFDTDTEITARSKWLKSKCLEKYNLTDCIKTSFQSVNTRKKTKNDLKLSLYFDQIEITHRDKLVLISLFNYVVSILSLWLGFSYQVVSKYAQKLLLYCLNLRQAQTLLCFVLFVGLLFHVFFIALSMLEDDLINITYYQPSKFILQPVFTLCWELEHIYHDYHPERNDEITGLYLTNHTKNLSQLVRSIRFLNDNFTYVELSQDDLGEFKGKLMDRMKLIHLNYFEFSYPGEMHHFRRENIEIEYFFYYKYKCYEFKHFFSKKRLYFDFELDTVFLQFNLADVELELMFYPDKAFGLENKIFIPSHSYTTAKYVAIYTLPLGEELDFCLDYQDDKSENLIRFVLFSNIFDHSFKFKMILSFPTRQVRDVLSKNEYYKISTKLLPLTHR